MGPVKEVKVVAIKKGTRKKTAAKKPIETVSKAASKK